MSIDTGRSRYSTTAMWLHWIIALIIIGNLVGGLTIDFWLDSPDAAMKQTGGVIMSLHKSLGLTVIVLTLLRLATRIASPPPPLPAHMTPLEQLLARATHLLFYILMLALPLSGWAMVSTGKTVKPIPWFGLFDVPALPLPASLHGVFGEGHEIIGFIAIATIALHIAGGLKHQYLDRDDVLGRMLPWLRRAGT
jgi:cytochrome b561